MKYLILILFSLSSVYGITFDCTFRHTSAYNVGNYYLCDATIAGIRDSRIVTNVTTYHIDGLNNADVGGISIRDYSDLDYIPQGITKFFPNLIVIEVIRSGLKELQGFELYEYPKLKLISVFANQIKRIPSNFLQRTPELVQIVFANNLIENVGANLITSMASMKKVSFINFEGNVCIQQSQSGSYPDFKPFLDNLKAKCTDVCLTDNLNERICGLEAENERLWRENVKIMKRLELIEQDGKNKLQLN